MLAPASVDVGWPWTLYHMLGRQKVGVHLCHGPRACKRVGSDLPPGASSKQCKLKACCMPPERGGEVSMPRQIHVREQTIHVLTTKPQNLARSMSPTRAVGQSHGPSLFQWLSIPCLAFPSGLDHPRKKAKLQARRVSHTRLCNTTRLLRYPA